MRQLCVTGLQLAGFEYVAVLYPGLLLLPERYRNCGVMLVNSVWLSCVEKVWLSFLSGCHVWERSGFQLYLAAMCGKHVPFNSAGICSWARPVSASLTALDCQPPADLLQDGLSSVEDDESPGWRYGLNPVVLNL